MAAHSPEVAIKQLQSQHGPQNYDTICGVQRALWPYINLLPEPKRTEAEGLLVTAYVMGSRMHARLVEQKRALESTDAEESDAG